MVPEYSARQRAAFSFTAAVKAWAPWRDIDVERLSFTEPGQDPASQMFPSCDVTIPPSIDVALRKLHIRPGDEAALGFAAMDEADARALEDAWKFLLAPPRGQPSDHRRPSLRKDTP